MFFEFWPLVPSHGNDEMLVGVHTPSPADHSTTQKRGIFEPFMATE